MANQFLEWLWRVLAAVCVLLERERKEKVFAFAWTGKEEGSCFCKCRQEHVAGQWAVVQSWSSTMIFVVFCEQILVCVITRVSRKVNLREGTSLSINYLVCNTIHIK